jgi:hypothetical protein
MNKDQSAQLKTKATVFWRRVDNLPCGQLKNEIKTWSHTKTQPDWPRWYLVNKPVVDDGAADLLVELEERLHLVDRDLGWIQQEQRNHDPSDQDIAGSATRWRDKAWMFTASRLVREPREMAELEGGPPRDGTPVAVPDPRSREGGGGRGWGGARVVAARGGGGGAQVGEAAGEGEEDGLGDGDHGEEHGAQPLAGRQRALRPLQHRPNQSRTQLGNGIDQRISRQQAEARVLQRAACTHRVFLWRQAEADARARLHGDPRLMNSALSPLSRAVRM